jgi:hypothetical protein
MDWPHNIYKLSSVLTDGRWRMVIISRHGISSLDRCTLLGGLDTVGIVFQVHGYSYICRIKYRSNDSEIEQGLFIEHVMLSSFPLI